MELLSNYDLLDLLDWMPAHEYLALTSTCTHMHSLKNDRTTQQKRVEARKRVVEYGLRCKISYFVLLNGNKDGLEQNICYQTLNYDQCKWLTKYVNGKREGSSWVWSYTQQQIVKRGRYIGDKKDGVWQKFDNKGVYKHTNYIAGIKDGIKECAYSIELLVKPIRIWVTRYYVAGKRVESSWEIKEFGGRGGHGGCGGDLRDDAYASR